MYLKNLENVIGHKDMKLILFKEWFEQNKMCNVFRFEP